MGVVHGFLVSPGGFDLALIGLSALVAAICAAGAGFLVGAAFTPREWEEARIAEARAGRAADQMPDNDPHHDIHSGEIHSGNVYGGKIHNET